jgi:hypothetical protein
MSWPVKRSALDAALVEGEVGHLIGLVYYLLGNYRVSQPHYVMNLDYRGERSGSFYAGKVTLSVYAVPSPGRKEAEREMLESILPPACRWIAAIPERPETWRWENQSSWYSLGSTER